MTARHKSVFHTTNLPMLATPVSNTNHEHIINIMFLPNLACDKKWQQKKMQVKNHLPDGRACAGNCPSMLS